jgi:uncharacterized membrane protein
MRLDSRRIAKIRPNPLSSEGRDRWRRRVLAGQGLYYVLIGLWPLVHFASFAGAVAVRVNPFQAHAFLEAVRREPPDAYPTLVGIVVAAAIALISLWWLPRLAVASALWIDLVIEVAFALALVLLYPRSQTERSRTSSRRR